MDSVETIQTFNSVTGSVTFKIIYSEIKYMYLLLLLLRSNIFGCQNFSALLLISYEFVQYYSVMLLHIVA